MMTNQEARPDGDPEKSLSEKPEAPASLPPQLQPGRDQKHGADEKALGGADAVSPAENDRGGDNDVDAEAAKPERVQSARPSMRAPTYVVVPRSQRRGLLARLTILPEIDRPYEYPDSTKWCITTFTAIAACIAPMGSAIFYPALPYMPAELDTTETIVNLTVAFYMLAMAIGPLWWSSFSETLGRRNIYMVSFSLNAVFCLLCGFSVNIAMLIVFRILAGGASASVQSVGAGTVSDIWEPRQRGRALGLFYMGALCGPMIGPIIGGALTEAYSWRSTMWFMTAYGAAVFFIAVFALPETLARNKPLTPPRVATPDPDTLQQQNSLSRVSSSVQVRTRKTAVWFKRCFVDPLLVVRDLRFPAVLCVIYYSSVTFATVYILNISIQSAFSKPPYSYDSLIIGLLYLPGTVGYAFTSVLGGSWIDKIMAREARKAGRYDAEGRLIYLPEDRMRENAWLAATVYPGALIWYGWGVQTGQHLAVPLVAAFFFGAASMLVFAAAMAMLTEFMPGRSSSGVALNNFIRNIIACIIVVVEQPLIDAIGHGWLMTMLGLICWISGISCIWLLRQNSAKWRVEMNRILNG